MSTSASPPPPRRSLVARLRPQISLRLLLALVTIFCVWLAVQLQRTKEQRRVARRLSLNSGTVYYDYMRSPAAPPSAIVPLGNRVEGFDVRRVSPLPQRLHGTLGEDFFYSVVAVHIRDCDHLRELHQLPRLEIVTVLGRSINDGDIESLSRCRLLRTFVSRGGDSELTDAALERLAKMPHLETLEVSGAFSSAGIAALARSRSLRKICLASTDDSVTSAAAAPFRPDRVPVLQIVKRSTLAGTATYTFPVAQDTVIVEW